MTVREQEADDVLKLELLRVTEALGLERTERLLRGIRRSLLPTHNQEINWAGQRQAVTEALGLERTERSLRGIRRSMRPESTGLSDEGQRQATQVVREWINTNPGPVEWLEPAEAWVKTGEIIQAYLTGAR